AVAHHGPAGDLLATTHAQRGDAADVHLVHRWRRAAEDHLVELVRRERLPYQEGAASLRRQITGGERSGSVARLEEWRASAVDDVDGSHAAFTIGLEGCSASSARPKSCGKSSTLMMLLRKASFFCHCAYSSGVIRPLSRASAPMSAPGVAVTLPFFTPLRSFSSIASQATAATKACSSRPVASSP